jgi:DnaJ-class molecular chaperone
MLAHHPDKINNNDRIYQTMLIIEAYNTLIDPSRREDYDHKFKSYLCNLKTSTDRHC